MFARTLNFDRCVPVFIIFFNGYDLVICSFGSNGDRPNLNKQRSVPGSCYKIYTPINVMFARAVSFCRFSFFMKNKIPLLPKLRKNVWFKSRSVPGSCYKIYTPINVMFARAVSFCRFSFFMKNKIPLLPKLRKNVWFKPRSVPILH